MRLAKKILSELIPPGLVDKQKHLVRLCNFVRISELLIHSEVATAETN
jgi:hypothetical protein